VVVVMMIGLDGLLALRDQHGSVFVFAGRGSWFWRRDIEAYPFPDGVLIIRRDEDECRWPGALVTEIAEGEYNLHLDRPDRAVALREQWLGHLAGFVEYGMAPVKLPDWAFPPDEGDLNV
jgi:hypothetical protein